MGSPSDFLSRFVLAPSLVTGPRNFARNEPVAFDPEHPHARDLIAWVPFNSGEENERAFNNPEITFTRRNVNYKRALTDRGTVGDLTSGDTGLFTYDTAGAISLSGNKLSLSCWVNLTADAFSIGGIYELTPLRKISVFSLGISPWSSKCRFLIGTTGGTTGWTANNDFSYSFQQDVWFHLAMSWDGTTAKVYIDGAKKSQFTVTGSLTENTERTCIGYDAEYSNVPEMPGYIYDARIYTRALDDSEIFEIYQGVQPLKPAIPIGVVGESATGPIYYNQSDVSIYYGSTSVTGVYRGSNTIWTQ